MSTLTTATASDIFRRDPDKFIDVDGAQVACRTIGSGPDVLFVHGWPVSGATFRTLLPYLVDQVTCHVVDLAGTGSSRFDTDSPLSVDHHIDSVRKVIDHLDTQSIALVGHDSGGMIARHVAVDDTRVRGLGLINTEPPKPGPRFNSFIACGKMPGFGAVFGWLAGQRRLRRAGLVLGDIFADRSFLDGEFDEFFLQPLHTNADLLAAAMKHLKSFDMKQHVHQLAAIHPKLDVPVQLVWGDQDPFFPLKYAQAMVPTFPDAQLSVVEGAGLFCHEEAPQAVAEALLPVLTGTRRN